METEAEGVCRIKEQFIRKDHVRILSIGHVADKDKSWIERVDTTYDGSKKIKIENGEQKKLKGQNKSRGLTFHETKDKVFCPELCDKVGETDKCSKANCPFQHDAADFLATKRPDIGPTCYIYSLTGQCPWGINCRFGSNHLTPEGVNKIDAAVASAYAVSKNNNYCLNTLSNELRTSLWKRKYDFTKSITTLKQVDVKLKRKPKDSGGDGEVVSHVKLNLEKPWESVKVEAPESQLGALDDSKDGNPRDKKNRIIWKDKLYLSPLTTVGNLPFRRICVEFGADITCGEMALSSQIIKGTREWALIKRHSSEKIFGAQICGNNPALMTKCAQLLEENATLDFIDINLGCPIDQLFEQGCGSGLLRRKKVLNSIVHGMGSLLDIPLTVKTRSGISSSVSVAHTYMPMFREAGVAMATVHGRSREQRYTKHSDWEYIEQCAQAAGTMPVFGNGDILSFEDYESFRERAPTVAGCMIGRGALIKPWIFQEIKERRHLDLSSSERLDMLKKYANYGLEHWGSDTRGVETTRRFILEWLSFLHRYVPFGLLERPPQRINQRPPFFEGRDDLETLMASSHCSDWIKISEMLLGPIPEGFCFLPKHKANAWK